VATVTKDFKVKHGLVVTNGGSFGSAVTVGTPTLGDHATTKDYVDALTGGMPVGNTAPVSPINGQLWFDTLTSRVNVYYNSTWITIATIDDTQVLPDHIHDTSIDGNGLIVSQFVSSGFYNAPQGTGQDGGTPSTSSWTTTYDGGTAIDNYN
jgi:hypothetical protein